MEIRITGADQLGRLAAECKAVGRNDLRKELLADIRRENVPIIAAVRESAASTLPSSGGLAGIVASSRITTRTRAAGRGVGTRIVGTQAAPLKRLNEGNLRHPLFGNRRWWFGQNVRAGWFDDPIERKAPEVRGNLIAGMDRIAAKIEGAP